MLKAALGLLALLASSPAAAQEFTSCVRKTETGTAEPATVAALLLCQESARKSAAREASQPGAAAPQGLAAFQEAELKDYLSRHPDQAPKLEKAREEAKEKAAGLARSAAAVAANAARLPAADAEKLQRLNEAIVKDSGGGARGLTPEAAKAIADYLREQQGGASVEMNDLLEALQADGPKLKDETMNKIKRAARAARAASGEGFDLGVDADLQKWLLDPATDPGAAPSRPATN